MRMYKYLFAGVLSILLIAGCGSNENKNNTVEKVAVEIEAVDYGDITVTKTYSGTLEGAEQSKIYASIPERVISIPAVEGRYIKKGSSVIILDKNGPASQYNQAHAVYRNAEDNFEKMQSLYNQKAISEMNFKGAKTAYEVAKANFNAARATIELTSPIDGIVTDISVNLGQQVPLGVPIATVARTSKMRLTIHVGLKEVEKLAVGKLAKVYIDSGEPIEAVIVESSKSADPNTRLFKVELEMDNPEGVLKPGMYGRANVIIEELENILTVNNRALFSEEGIYKVYIITDNVAYIKSVQTGYSDGERTQVISGLSEGEQVVIVGKSALRDATPVVISEKDTEDVSG